MKKLLSAVALVSGTLLSAETQMLYRSNFNTPAELKGWSSTTYHQSSGGRGNSGCFYFSNDKETQNKLISMSLDLRKVRGRGILVRGWLKGENITRPRLSYLGPKLMLAISYGDNEHRHPDTSKKYGSYGWQEFTVFARIPRSATGASLCLGLQGCTGKLWIDDVSIQLLPKPELPASGFDNRLPVPEQTQFRGVMSGNDLSESALRELREVWNANLIRFQIKRRGDNSTPEGFRRIIDRHLEQLDAILPAARKYGIHILIDMHVGPGTRQTKLLSNQMSWEPAMQQLLADVWKEIALKYRNEPMIWGYDLLNEPNEKNYVYTPGGSLDWNRLAEKIARAIREVDPDKPIIVETVEGGGAFGFDIMQPINVPKIIYSFHFYSPHEYTHQGVGNRTDKLRYPGKVSGKIYDKAALEKELEPVIKFQKKYNVPIYVGEFGVIRWAENADQWLDDVISLFEKYGWDWTYHAFREFHGWDAEIDSDPASSRRTGATPRREVLRRYMKRNSRPQDATPAGSSK